MVATNHQFVKVFCDSALVYEEAGNDSMWGHTSGSVWNFTHVPYGTKTVCIQLKQAYENYSMDNVSVYVGNDREIYCTLLENSLFSMVCSVFIVLIGIFLIIVWAIVSRNSPTSKAVFYLGTVGLILGFWSFNETTGATILINNRIGCSFMAFILLKLLGPTFILFTYEFFNVRKGIIWNVYCGFVLADGVITFLLQIFNIADFKQTVLLTHLLIVSGLFYSMKIAFSERKNEEKKKQVKMYITGSAIIFISSIADMLYYYLSGRDADTFGRVGFLIFAVIIAKQVANNSLRLMEKGKYASIYEKMAIVDRLTGLYNRNAYEIDIKKIPNLNGFMVVTFDLNDLKSCNDTKGHTQGDNYIVTAAKMIEEIFGLYGRCYRIGGDEFCTIIRNGAICPIGDLLQQLEARQVDYNKETTENEFPIHIAVGYALYDVARDSNMEAIRERADSYMYRNKHKIKTALSGV